LLENPALLTRKSSLYQPGLSWESPYLIEVLGDFVVELDDTLFSSHVSLDGYDFSSIPSFFSSGIEFVGCSLEYVFSTTVDDHLIISLGGEWREY